MKFIIEVKDKHVRELEGAEDTVFRHRLTTMILRELQKYNPNAKRDDVAVMDYVDFLGNPRRD